MALTEYTPQLVVRVGGKDWHLERAADLEALWNAMGETDWGDDERLPYWTELWPSSVALGEWLVAHKDVITGRCCLDMGCGLGLTAMIGAWLGARVVAMDYEPQALHFAARNAVRNGVPSPLWTVMDWRMPGVRASAFDCVWGGDIMYERRFVEPVLDFLAHVLSPQGVAWVAEPNRSVYAHFRSLLDRRGWRSRPLSTENVSALYEQPSGITVTIWELRRPAGEIPPVGGTF